MPSKQEVEDSFEAVPAYIVADKRDKFGKRLGQAGIGILILFFAIGGYIQSARTGAKLDEAGKQREKLIESQATIAKTLQGQGVLIVQLQETVTRQNDALRKAGLPVEPVPNLQDLINSIIKSSPSPSPSAVPNNSGQKSSNPSSGPKPGSSPTPAPKPKPSPKPSPRPKPSPSPTRDPATRLVCDLTGICLPQ